ncbi:MAG TPA: serine hydrolase domain-containing protein [Bacteroidia bacterium]|jgi:CubicO group peptidase (beta-lactamase class C family)|nr:serine hydrolase domain-containing protein [Bacteroidia bacterium]
MRTALSFLLILILSIRVCSQTEASKSGKIEAYMKQAHQLGVFNGNALVMENDLTVYRGSWGYSDADKKIPLTEKSIFRIGSIAKEFNAVGIMMLKEQGKLRLDQTVNEFFPDLPSWSKKIKIIHLLQYTSGLPDVNWYTIKSEEDNWKDLYALNQLKFEPGSDYFYNNNNTFLQRKIIEKITGMKFNDFVQQQILTPCGVTHAIIDPIGTEPFVTQSFDDNFKQDSVVLHVTGWTCVNIDDLYKWSQALTNFKNINPVSTLEILTPVAPGRQAGLGGGTMKNNRIERHVHDGTSQSSQALMVTDASKKRTVLFLTNQRHDNLREMNEDITNILENKPYSQPRKSILKEYAKQLNSMNAEEFMSFYKSLKDKYPSLYGFDNANTLNEIGYYFLYDKKSPVDAIAIFELNVTLFPKSGYVVDSLAEGYLKNGDKKKALHYYKESIALGYNENHDAKKIIEDLEK